MEPIIQVTSLKKSFKSNHVLKDVSFYIPKGSIFALLGSNGAGKTTAIRILSTLSKADGGSATICGYDVKSQPSLIRECISLTGQFAAVDDILTGRENLRLIGKLRRLPNAAKRADDLLTAFDLEEAANRQAHTYSGGMKRRLDIAMSLMGNPQVIFLDEPTTGLDPQSRIAMWEMVKGLAGSGITVLLTTQYLEEAEYLADYIAILHDGIITAKGTAQELKTTLPRGSVQLDFNKTADADNARTLLDMYRVKKVEGESRSIDVSTNGSASQFADVLTRIENSNIPLVRFTQKLPTLEDVFLKLVNNDSKHKEENKDA